MKVLISLGKEKNIANFHVLGLLYLKNEFRAKKSFSSVTRRCWFLDETWGAASSVVLSARKLKFWLPASFEPTWCTSYSVFWNFEIALKTQESKNFEISLENFQKMLDGPKFGKRCLLEISIQNFFQIWKILNSWIFLKNRSKICLSPSGYKLESWNFAWTCFARLSRKLHTQIWNSLKSFPEKS
jgi:hypothetical protein